MADTYHKELLTLSRAKNLISLLPSRLRFRTAKKLYNYESDNVNGIDLIAPLQNDGLVCFINTKDVIGWKIFFFGEYEAGTNKTLAKYIKKNDVVIEAGANLGSETILLSKLVGEGHVYAFEPNPYTFKRLQINIGINELSNVSCYDIAMGEKDGDISFNIYPKGFCNPGMSSKYMETKNTKKINVKQQTVDSFVKENNIKKVDFIKMDIQGAEMDLIHGAANTLRTFKPKVFMEALAEYNNINDMYNVFKGHGYDVFDIGENEIKIMSSPSDVKDGNWIAIHK